MTVEQEIEGLLSDNGALESELLSGLCAESFLDFIETVMPEYIFNWHHLVLIDALQRLAE